MWLGVGVGVGVVLLVSSVLFLIWFHRNTVKSIEEKNQVARKAIQNLKHDALAGWKEVERLRAETEALEKEVKELRKKMDEKSKAPDPQGPDLSGFPSTSTYTLIRNGEVLNPDPAEFNEAVNQAKSSLDAAVEELRKSLDTLPKFRTWTPRGRSLVEQLPLCRHPGEPHRSIPPRGSPRVHRSKCPPWEGSFPRYPGHSNVSHAVFLRGRKRLWEVFLHAPLLAPVGVRAGRPHRPSTPGHHRDTHA